MDKQSLYDYIDKNADAFIGVSDRIWELAELSLKEFQSADLYCEVLERFGFTVERNLGGMATAFSGAFRSGSGQPVIGILGEFDALSGLSQAGGVAERRSAGGTNGHGCNHNLLGAGSLAAACAVKDFLERTGTPGTVIFFGCPGEEGGAGKAFLAREGAWRKLDAAVTWHPDYVNHAVTGSCLSCIQKEYRFTGVAAHAAGSPEAGRSALDALELMNTGVQYLREHMPPNARVHYAISDGGGISPNVVQPTAAVLYMVRDHSVSEALALQARVDKIAEAAAMMTETTVSVRFIDGCSDTVSNACLEEAAYANLCAAPLPDYTPKELDYAAKLIASFPVPAPTLAAEYAGLMTPEQIDYVNRMTDGGKAPINAFVLPYFHSERVHMGSTDVGDVSWQCPTVQVYTACQAAGSPGHSWQNVSCGKSSLGYKGMLYAGKVLAGLTVDLLTQRELLEKAKAEFAEKTKGGYLCPIPPDAVPTAI